MKLYSLVYPSNLKIRFQKIAAFSAIFGLILSLILLIPVNSSAKVTGVCSNCHTMHNSQGGSSMQTGYNPGADPQANLVRGTGCLGCHGAADGGTWQGVGGAPIVYNAAAPTYAVNGLAAGNFYYVTQNQTYGHNVTSIPGVALDTLIGTNTPGRGAGCGSCHDADSGGVYIFTDGVGGGISSACEWCHDVKHHADDSGPVVGASGGYYRFLSLTAKHPASFQQGSNYNFDGAEGIEDSDWEKTVSSTDHNEYSGTPGSGYSHSISTYCACCHEDFHGAETQSGSSWIRHPSDHVLPNSGEYASYTTYSPEAPIARDPTVLAGMTGPSQTVTPGSDQVSCLSCHRAHGSPEPDMLRWDYSGMLAGGGGSGGCFTCHTEKN